MDQARWFVVLSVVVVMLTVLTLLSRHSQPSTPASQTQTVKSEAQTSQPQQTERAYTASKRKIRQPSASSIKYSTPPKHVFAIDTEGIEDDNKKISEKTGR